MKPTEQCKSRIWALFFFVGLTGVFFSCTFHRHYEWYFDFTNFLLEQTLNFVFLLGVARNSHILSNRNTKYFIVILWADCIKGKVRKIITAMYQQCFLTNVIWSTI